MMGFLPVRLKHGDESQDPQTGEIRQGSVFRIFDFLRPATLEYFFKSNMFVVKKFIY